MKRILSLVSLLLFAAFVHAQPLQQRAITVINSTPTATCTAGSCVLFDMKGQGTASVQVSGTYTASGGLSLQATTDGTTWVTVGGSGTFRRLSTGVSTATITSAEQGVYQLSGDCVGAYACRITALGAVTGSATVSVLTSAAAAGGVANISGGAGDASAANQVAGNASLTSIDAGIPAALGQAVAANSMPVVLPVLQNAVNTQGSTTSGQSGALVQGAVTTAAPTYTTGQTSPLSLDTSGQLRITGTVSAGGVAQGSTTSGQTGNLIQGAVSTSAPSYTTAQTSPLSLDTAGNLRVNVVTGGAGGGNVTGGTAHDAVGTSVNPVLIGAYASAAAPADVSADGDATRIWTLRNGAVANQQTYAGVLAVAGNGASGTGVQRVTIANDSSPIGALTETAPGSDTASSGLNGRLQRIAQNLTTLNTSVNADPNYTQTPGSAVPTRGLYMGARTGANLVPVAQGGATVAVSMSSATTTQHVALSGSTLIYVTGFTLISAGTTNVTLVYGTGTNCGTGTTSLSGAMPLIANAGLSVGSGLGPILVVPAGQALCITNSAGVQISGWLTYTQF